MKIRDVLLKTAYMANEESFLKLCNDLNKESKDWMLCLGAGVSISAGLPNWYGLLAKMSARLMVINPGKNKDETHELNEFELGRKVFYEKYGTNEKFLDSIERALKGEYAEPFYSINVLESAEYIEQFIEDMIPDKDKELTDYYIKFLIKHSCQCQYDKKKNLRNTALGSVARLMTEEKEGSGLPIHNVITYNYDNLLEHCLRLDCGCPDGQIYSCVEGGEIKDLKNPQCNIYHIHGRVPVVDEDKEGESKRVILTESSYYNEEKMNYSWINILQSYALVRAGIIFIGFSGADYNFRRVIKNVSGNRTHYIFFCVDDIVKNVFKNKIQEEVVEKAAKQKKEGEKGPDLGEIALKILEQRVSEMKEGKHPFERLYIDQLRYMQGSYWSKHNIRVIWTTIEELPQLLDRLHNKTNAAGPY